MHGMTTRLQRSPRRSTRTLLLATAAAVTLAVAPSLARAHDGHQRGGFSLAQAPGGKAGHQAPRRTEMGVYGQDLPRGAAAPASNERPPLRDNFGTLGWPGASANAEAQAYFDQGYRFGWAFNHGEAARNFRTAQQIDPNCAACFWGEAWALGPNINYPMSPEANARALAALDQARRLAPQATGPQRALIEALSKRHAAGPQADQAALNAAYAEAMDAVQQRYPTDPHIAVLTADAMMNVTPWDYWADGGRTPKGHAARIVALLEAVLGEGGGTQVAAMPDHPGAIHLYIHAVEASDRPERAAPHAPRLAELVPGSGHLVHMPSHIYYRLGRWHDSLEANRAAAAASEALIAEGGQSLIMSQAYYPHNVHFLVASALMGGDGPTAVEAAQKLADLVSERAQREVPWTQPIAAGPYVAHARFTAPAAVLELPAPVGDFPFVRAHWHYARGVALARQGRAEAAHAEAAAIERLGQRPEVGQLAAAGIPAQEVLGIAQRVIAARVAQQAGDHAKAARLFGEAGGMQDRLPYMEPPFWYYPIHQSLGAELLALGKPQEAEAAFRAALERVPNNGWAATGLLRAAEARGDTAAAAEARALLDRSWFGGEPPANEQL
jgi:tetratricopeptide (TPR) repeat protein